MLSLPRIYRHIFVSWILDSIHTTKEKSVSWEINIYLNLSIPFAVSEYNIGCAYLCICLQVHKVLRHLYKHEAPTKKYTSRKISQLFSAPSLSISVLLKQQTEYRKVLPAPAVRAGELNTQICGVYFLYKKKCLWNCITGVYDSFHK